MWAGVMRRVDLNGLHLRISAAGMLLAAILLPLLPGHGWVLCPLRLTTGIPCPLCGMTTSVVATSRGRFSEALAANPAGIAALFAALGVIIFRPKRVRLPVAGLAVLGAAMWMFELNRFSIL